MYNCPLISVIVPAYNAQEYIEDCIKSVIDQTYSSWELIIIDDGSIDETMNICMRYTEQDSRIFLSHQNNKGVSAARNAGIQFSNGEYIAFLDADDLLPPNSLENRLNTINNCDMMIGGFVTFKGERVVKERQSYQEKEWNIYSTIENILKPDKNVYQGYLFNKLFCSRIIKGYSIKFATEIAYNEDRLFCICYLLQCKTEIKITNQLIYKYRDNPNGAMGRMNHIDENNFTKIKTEFIAFDFLKKLLREYDEYLYFLNIVEAQKRASYIYRHVGIGKRKIKKELKQYIVYYGNEAIRHMSRKISFVERLKIFIHRFFLI